MTKQNSPLVLGTEPIGKLLTQYAIPAIIAMTASSLYNMADSIFIGHGVGALAISGLALTFPLMNLAAAFGSLVGVGASTLVAVKLGQKDYEGANNVLGNVLILNVVLGVAFTIAFLFLLDPVLYFFGASENTISYARDYMRIILYGNVVTHMYLGLNAVVRSSGYGIVNRIAFLFVMIIMGFNQGMQPIAGYNYGARLYSRVTDVTRLTMRWAVGVATLGFLLCQLVPSWIVRMFTSDGELISAASYGLHIVFAVFPIVGFQMVATNFFLSIGMSKKAIFLSLTRQMLFLIPCLIILPPLFGTLGVWISMPIADTVAAIVTAIVLVKQFKQFKYGT
ncbi:MAG: MATE family efflux transporter [Parabacteroides distasonis]|nr:MATE family efflux transporter [Parabacteroides distasonis]